MPTNAQLLMEVLIVEADLNKAQRMLDNKRSSLTGKLPFIRSTLKSKQIKLDAQRIRIQAAKKYLVATNL